MILDQHILKSHSPENPTSTIAELPKDVKPSSLVNVPQNLFMPVKEKKRKKKIQKNMNMQFYTFMCVCVCVWISCVMTRGTT